MTGPEVLHQKLASANPGTIAGVINAVTQSMTSLDSSADSLVLATSGMEWQGQDREAFNQQIWATKALAEMAHMRCSMGKVSLKSVRGSLIASQTYADLVISTWRTNKALPLDGPTLTDCRDRAIEQLTDAIEAYEKVLLAATDYLPTDELAQQDGDKEDWKDYLRNGGLSQKQIEALEKGLGHSMLRDLDRGMLPGPVIPDIEVNGNDDGWTPQGVGYSPDNGGTMVQVGYGGKGDDSALASIIDPDTGELINSVKLGGWVDSDGEIRAPHHVGSVVVDGDDVWITAGGGDSRAIRYSLSDLRNATVGATVPSKGSAALKDGGHSFSTIHTDRSGTTYLYAGNFWDDRMYRYEKVGSDWVRDEGYEVKTPEFTQGVVVTDDRIAFSTSYGRDYESLLKTYDRGVLETGGDASSEDGLVSNIALGNMSEGITMTPEGLAVLHESGAADYIGADDEWVSPFMTLLSPDQAGISGGGIEITPATVREAATKLGAVEDELASAAKSIYAIHLPPSAVGGVTGAGDFATALNLHLDATGIWLKRSEISAGISVDGLRASADEHEWVDTRLRDLYEWDREHLGLADKGRDAYEKGKDVYEKGKDLAGDAKEKIEDVDLTPWDGLLPG